MKWSDVLLTGTRRLAALDTYAVVAAGLLAGIVLPYLIELGLQSAFDPPPGAVAVITGGWLYLVGVWVTAALATAAATSGRTRFTSLASTTFSNYGRYLTASVVITGLQLASFAVILLVSLLGLGGTSTAPVLGVLSPVLIVGAGLAVAVLVVLYDLAIASVASRGCLGLQGVAQAWSLMRTRAADVFLWVGATSAVAFGIFIGVGLPLLSGALSSVWLQLGLLTAGARDELGSSPAFADILDKYVLAGTIILLTYFLLVGVVFGIIRAFVIGSAVGFVRMSSSGGPAVSPGAGVVYCDRCGARSANGTAFCETCGQALGVA